MGGGLNRRAVGLVVAAPLLAALSAVTANAASSQPRWPGGLDVVQRHPWISLGIVSLVCVAVEVVLWWPRPGPPSVDRWDGRALDRAADRLADAVKGQWDRAAAERRLRYPAAVAVSWKWSDRPVAGRVVDATGSDVGHRRFGTLPGTAPTRADQLSGGGRLGDLDAIFGGLESGRMVIIGEPGAGKTAAAIILLHRLLDRRAESGDDRRSVFPVPVLLTLSDWNIDRHERLIDWLGRRLTTEYPFLKSAGENANAVAAGLVDSGRVAVMLDGLDDLPEPSRPVALRILDEQATFRLVLLARSHEMVRAAGSAHLSGAAAVELLPVAPADAADYLARCAVHPPPRAWQRLVTHVRDNPHSPVTQAVTTPLMLSLVRDTYRGSGEDQIGALLDPARYPTRERVEGHLLDRIVPTAYAARPGSPAPRYSVQEAQRCLSGLAYLMNLAHTRDLAWWRLTRWTSAPFRVWMTLLLVAAVIEIPLGVPGALLLSYYLSAGPGLWWLAVGAFAALPVGVAATEIILRDREPQQVGRPRWRSVLSPTRIAVALSTGLLVWVGFGPVAGVACLVMLIAVGVIVAFGSSSVEPTSPLDPLTCWRRDRRYGLLSGGVAGASLGVVVGLLLASRGRVQLPAIMLAPVLGLGFGALLGFAYSRTWPTMLAFVQLQRAGFTLRHLMRFLEDARARDIVRVAGPVYQFRHARLQDRLAGSVRVAPVAALSLSPGVVPAPPGAAMPLLDTRVVGRRVLQILLDGWLFLPAVLVLLIALTGLSDEPEGPTGSAASVALSLLLLAGPLWNWVVRPLHNGQTWGMQTCGLRVLLVNGQPVRLGRLLGRFAMMFITYSCCGGWLDLIVILSTPRHQSIADFVTGTVIVRDHQSLPIWRRPPGMPESPVVAQEATTGAANRPAPRIPNPWGRFSVAAAVIIVFLCAYGGAALVAHIDQETRIVDTWRRAEDPNDLRDVEAIDGGFVGRATADFTAGNGCTFPRGTVVWRFTGSWPKYTGTELLSRPRSGEDCDSRFSRSTTFELTDADELKVCSLDPWTDAPNPTCATFRRSGTNQRPSPGRS